MHPPWITFNFILFLSAMTCTSSGDAEQNEAVNSTISRPQREIYERERRLIPYMTYYVTQSLTSTNGGAKQSILVPVTSPRGNIFQLDATPKIPLSNVHTDSAPIPVVSKPVVRLSSPTFLTPAIQVGQYKGKEGIFPQIYRLESGIIRPRIQAQVKPQQIQSETQPLQVVKVNPVSTEQKYTVPQIIKIIPVITKLPREGSDKPFRPQQPSFAYAEENVQPSPQHPSVVNYQDYYKETVPSHIETSFQENKVYASHVSRENPQPKLIVPQIGPDANKYTVAKIVLSSTTAPPYDGVKFRVNDGGVPTVDDNVHRVSIVHLRPSDPGRVEYEKDPPVISTVPTYARENYVSVTGSQQPPTYGQRANAGRSHEPQYLIQSQKAAGLPKLRVPEEEKIRFVASVTQVPVTNDLESVHWKVTNEGHTEKNENREPLNNIFSLLKETNKLPQNLTPDNIDTGIKTLALILERLQQQKNYYRAQNNPPSGSTTPEPPAAIIKDDHRDPKKIHSFPEKSGTSTPGRPGIDYPTYSTIPQTNFDCSTQRYKGFFGDPDTNCQVWHYCDLNGGQASFLCPNGTIFSQVALTCDWWFNVKCASTSQLYVLNERLYKYILPFSPSFPEDYSGPVVDTYLEAKFKEMEAKSKLKALKSPSNSTTTEKLDITTEAPTNVPTEYPTQNTEV